MHPSVIERLVEGHFCFAVPLVRQVTDTSKLRSYDERRSNCFDRRTRSFLAKIVVQHEHASATCRLPRSCNVEAVSLAKNVLDAVKQNWACLPPHV